MYKTTRLKRCRRCGKYVSDEQGMHIDPFGFLCHCCYGKCEVCGKLYMAGNAYTMTYNGEEVVTCGTCLYVCHVCHNAFKAEDMHDTPDGYKICNNCGVECSICHHHFKKESGGTYTNSGEPVCYMCEDRYTMPCPVCYDLVLIHRPDVDESIDWEAEEPCDPSTSTSCDTCYLHFCDRHRENHQHFTAAEIDLMYREPNCHDSGNYSQYIRNYTYVPTEHHFLTLGDEQDLFMGVELEVDKLCSQGLVCKPLAKSYPDIIYFKMDGSLSSLGLEIITMPATLNYHLASFPWPEIRRAVIKAGGSSHNAGTCGLHIHVNKNFFGDDSDECFRRLCFGKLAYLFQKFWLEMAVFARRTSFKYCSRPNLYNQFMPYYIDKRKAAFYYTDVQPHDGRYQAINLLKPPTVEFRLWRGTLKLTSLYATLEFTHALCHIAKNVSIMQLGRWRWQDLIDEAMRVRKYKNLPAYLGERKLIGIEHDNLIQCQTTMDEVIRFNQQTQEEELCA